MNFDDINLMAAKLMFKLDGGARRRLWRKIAKLLGNGVQIINALQDKYDRRVAYGDKNHPEAIALKEWISRMRNGERFSVAISNWVGDQERMLISAGDVSGDIVNTLEKTCKTMEHRSKINAALFSGLAYPGMLLIVTFAVLYMFSFRIVPAFSRVPDDRWVGLAKYVVHVSGFVRENIFLMGGAVIAILVAFFISLPRFDGFVRVKLDRLPPYNVYRILHGSTFLIGLSALVSAGLGILDALEQMSKGASPWMKNRIRACMNGMNSGHSLGEALHKSGYEFPDREIIDDLVTYSKLGDFGAALDILGNEWIEESVSQIKGKMGVVFGISIIMVTAVIAFMVGGMLEMQFQMGQFIRSGGR